MAEDNRTPAEKFEAYNPYAASITSGECEGEDGIIQSNLAVAFAIDRLRTEVHFALKGRSS